MDQSIYTTNNSIRLAPPFSQQETVAAPQVARCASFDSSQRAIAPVIRTTRKEALLNSITTSTNNTTETTNNQTRPQTQQQPVEAKLVDRLMDQLRSSTVSLQLVLFIFALLFVSHLSGSATATPLLSISSSGSSSKEIAEAGSSSNSNSNSISASGDKATTGEPSQLFGGLKTANTADKLKRGLTNFMNHLNAAPFFVPTIQPQPHPVQQQQLQQQQDATNTLTQNGLQVQEKTAAAQSSSAEPATIVTGDSSLVGLKGPAIRWARPIGGPLRWGRR